MRAFALTLAVSMVGACGGSAFTVASNDAGAGTTGGDAGATDGSKGGGDSGSSADGSNGSDGGAGSDGGSAEAGPPCPDLSGNYMIGAVQGPGCGDLNPNAKQCIRMNAQISACGIAFVSPTPNGSAGAINGFTQIQPDGSFANASLREGSMMRSGCTGSWVPASSTMTVDCGGMATTQSCIVALTRTGPPSCN